MNTPQHMFHNGVIYYFKNKQDKDDYSDDIRIDRRWFIVKTEPNSNKDINNSNVLADIYIQMKYLGCRYHKAIEDKVNKYL